MRQTIGIRKSPGEKVVKDIKRETRKHYSSEEKISRIAFVGSTGAGQTGHSRHHIPD